jgi:flagellar assembly factor FliW
MENLQILGYLFIGVLITLGILGFDNILEWRVRNIPKEFVKLSLVNKTLIVTLPLTYPFVIFFLALIALTA